MIRSAEAGDANSLAELYNYYVSHSVTTFEETPVSGEEMGSRVSQVQAIGLPWLVLESEGAIRGYACAVRWKSREAYRHSVESTIYLEQGQTGRGHGVELYRCLLEQLRVLDVHSVLGGIALPNDPSVALHEKMGFTKVAHLSEVGYKFGRWIDVGYWQHLLTSPAGIGAPTS